MTPKEEKQAENSVSISDGFSRFFREASSSEQERVIGEAVRKSSEDQKALIDRYHQTKTS